MRSLWKSVVLAGGLVGIAATGHATMMTLEDTTYFTATGTNAAEDYSGHGWGDVNKLSAPTYNWSTFEIDKDYVSWKHLFNFNPAADEIVSGTIELYLEDDEGDKMYNPYTWEAAIGWAEDGSWDWGDVDTGVYGDYDLDVGYLGDGQFDVNLMSTLGDFYINKSVLTIDYIPVPEPTTLLLLGSGLGGLFMARRRKTQ